MLFEKLPIDKSLLETLTRLNYNKTFPIQEKAIPTIIKGKDILAIAPTGSGKTASYVLPILTNLQKNRNNKPRHIDVLVLVPTRELAEQVKEEFQLFSSTLPERIKVNAVYGGVSINPQMIAVQKTNILVATPGRLIDLVESNATSLSDIQTLVIDEADKLLNMGFKEEVEKVFSFLPKKRQNLLFSATLSDKVENIQSILLDNPTVIKIEEKKDTIDLINQTGYFIEEEEKGPFLRHLIKSKKYSQILIFTSSTFKADSITDKLRKNKIDARAIHGKKSQNARLATWRDFKNGSLKILVATDIFARGIDIEFLPCVINYDLPRSPKDYIHRIGRTGRAESSGDAIAFVTSEDKHHFKVIQKKMKKWVTMIDADNIDF